MSVTDPQRLFQGKKQAVKCKEERTKRMSAGEEEERTEGKPARREPTALMERLR